MIINVDPDRRKAVSTHRTCAFHQANPSIIYAGCGCSSSYALVPVSEEEYQERKKERDRLRREELLRELASL